MGAMKQHLASHHTFLGGIAATAAVIGSVALLGREDGGVGAAPDGIKAVPAAAGVPTCRAVPHEAERWIATVGELVRIDSETGRASGTILSVTPLNGKCRPANVGAEPFMVTFAMDTASTPSGDRIYRMDSAIGGLTQLFLTRAMDRRAEAGFPR